MVTVIEKFKSKLTFKIGVQRHCARYVNNLGLENGYKDLIKAVEKEALIYAFIQSNKNVVKTANNMGARRSSVYSICKRLGLRFENGEVIDITPERQK